MGRLRLAEEAGPLSPAKPDTPVPASVVTVEVSVEMRRTRWPMLSPIITEGALGSPPAAAGGTNVKTPFGPWNSAVERAPSW